MKRRGKERVEDFTGNRKKPVKLTPLAYSVWFAVNLSPDGGND
jgi:hypothetical protein